VRNQDLGTIMLGQADKIEEALKEFRMEDCHPWEVKPMLGKASFTQPEDAHLPYRNLGGTLGYLAHTTRDSSL